MKAETLRLTDRRVALLYQACDECSVIFPFDEFMRPYGKTMRKSYRCSSCSTRNPKKNGRTK